LRGGFYAFKQKLEQSPDAASAAHGLRELVTPEVYQKALDKMNSPERLDFKAWAMGELSSIKKDATQLEADVTAQAAESKSIDSTELHPIKQKEAIGVLQKRCDKVSDMIGNVSLKSLEIQGYTDDKITEEIEEANLAVTHTASKLVKLLKEQATSEVAGQTEEKITDIYAPGSVMTPRHHCSRPSPHRLDEVNPTFYHEKQEQGLCLKHALNVFVGFEAFGISDLIDGNLHLANMSQGSVPYKNFPKQWLKVHPQHTRKDIETNGDKIFYQVSKEHLQEVAGGIPLEDYVKLGNKAIVGEAILDRYQKQLGAPDVIVKRVATIKKAQKAIEKAKAEGDRILIGYKTHFLTYRQNKDGDWFRIDSGLAKQVREDPSAMVAKMDERSEVFYYKNKDPNIKTW
ncbi:MAG: hypothetical protein ACNYNY_03510, partial [Candidatus Oxydemutatoraceae bacterium WSBS_2016_MAG_OTU14]